MVEFAKKTEAEISKVQDLTKLFIKMQTEAQQKAEQENRALIEKMQASFNEQIK
jgi:predicted component of type VI protein secretion system